MAVLKAEGLAKQYGKRQVVRGVGIEVNTGEAVGLLGPNGAGKTTIFYMTVGMIQPDTGNVWIDELDITTFPMYKRAQAGIGYLPQEASIFRGLTVEENLIAILETMHLSKKQQRERCEALLCEFNIVSIARQKGYTLSGGERRRCEIARLLVPQPDFLLLDEPFVGIDPIAVSEIQRIIGRLKDKGIGVLITDHNVRETLQITDRSYIIYDGEVLLSGVSDFLVNDPVAKRVYLGEKFKM
ncbi:LPS export ABC transporter ATP-binding protein [Candidatus Desantisbacteria bacterium CG_4_9_14_3_um_filter_40_11]|uniref:LPS export ABC transporter ATP-binding protein n=3 Tax=unclassified Candidatus Desantisiibacteriota TaxID=3106372 RepID=A0A2M7JEL5_9BACT|nr:MAG: LPS export ABC transporter ATP-binding protein [Candidatus Desantisbacteria bacterium CG23_combo_of_CG06-09_8_20_14_all_40_23]PIX17841.1 MAG: LPS export ABC transporter ATP-binding protein [Candidatus Desantisbacteria bacterium CG_4_8_14_3_um_filter_40_12]PJB29467.1 MAG: LPS export ABC transporter ATP-binding protein [Candidatus Desantisbacteria bacterium CG_4_9_14_3_um_filter_40_11]